MKRFLLYGHGGSYNHGAEAIVKSTINIIRGKYDNAYIALSSNFPEQDREFGIDADEFFSPIPDIWEEEKRADSGSEKERLAREMYSSSLDFISPDTVCLSVGGDNFCYPNWHRLAVFQRNAAQKKAKSILWGCSVEPSAITPEMEDVLSSYTHILSRESRTYNALRKPGINTDVQLLPDPAFALESKLPELPEGFESGNTIGVNISPLVMRREPVPGILRENMLVLIDFILSETDMKIMLIPHVTMPMDNDYSVLAELKQALPSRFNSRVWLPCEKYSAAELKSVISICGLIVCARTHVSIAAYSSGVPALVMGYSVKSWGIAESLGMEEFVLDIAGITSPCSVRDTFKLLRAKSDDVGNALGKKLKRYIELTKDYAEYI